MITLGTLAQATGQEVFNQVATHLLTQMEQSKGNSTCQYRSDDGKLKCAAGCLISEDEMLQVHIQNENEASWHGLVNAKLAPIDHMDLIVQLQGVHDDDSNVENWRESLSEVAENFNLTMPKI